MRRSPSTRRLSALSWVAGACPRAATAAPAAAETPCQTSRTSTPTCRGPPRLPLLNPCVCRHTLSCADFVSRLPH